jgi:hypothetical protein
MAKTFIAQSSALHAPIAGPTTDASTVRIDAVIAKFSLHIHLVRHLWWN